MKKWLLIDSKALMFRCHEGHTITTNKDNMQVQGIIGYLSFIQKMTEDLDFDCVMHILDSRSKWRLALWPEYKGNRPPPSPEFQLANKSLNWLLPRLGEIVYSEDGQEADDLIATLAAKLSSNGDSVLIWSPDKDLSQLIEDDKVAIVKPKTRLGDYVFWTEASVLLGMGVTPKQIPDFLALVGDTADNIPGVPGFGPKKAAEQLRRTGNLLSMLQDPPPGTLGTSLLANKAEVMLWHQLTLLPNSLPIPHPKSWSHSTIKHYPAEKWVQILPMNQKNQNFWVNRQADAHERNMALFADNALDPAFGEFHPPTSNSVKTVQTTVSVETSKTVATAAVAGPIIQNDTLNIVHPPKVRHFAKLNKGSSTEPTLAIPTSASGAVATPSVSTATPHRASTTQRFFGAAKPPTSN